MLQAPGRRTDQVPCASWGYTPPARTHVRLLGPCFKTGRWTAFRQHPEGAVPEGLPKQHPEASVHHVATPKHKALGESPTRQTHADQQPVHSTNPMGRCVPGRTRGGPSLPSQQFQALFNSLFKVLFIFPSRYLFAIGLPSIFSLRWDLPPP
jgi:hypothetical protein